MNLPTLTVLINGTDVTAYVMLVDGYSVSRGRADWQGAVTAGELTLTLNNSDGRFTPSAGLAGGFDTLPFGSGVFGGGASSIAVDASIVLKETVNGTTFTRFTGFVKSWPVSWPATVSTFSTVQLTATDAQARAERRVLRSILEQEILADSPTAYYTLSEGVGSVAAGDTSGNSQRALTVGGTGTAPVFGATPAPGIDGLTATQFAGAKSLGATATSGTWFSLSTGFSFECWMSTTTVTSFAFIVYIDDGTNGVPTGTLEVVQSGGRMVASIGSDFRVNGATTLNDGAFHHLAVTISSTGTITGYVDGVSIGTTASVPTRPALRLFVGAVPPETLGGTLPFTGTISHVALYSSVLSPTRIATHAASGFGTLVESSTARLTRLAGYAGLTVGTLDASLTTVPVQATSGEAAMDAIQAVSDAELGTTYLDGTGALTFHNRNRVVAKTVPDLTLDHQWVTPDVQPVVDDQQIVNYFEATAQGTGGSTAVRNAASESAHGRYPASQTYLVRTDQEALDRANWTVANFAEPTPRYGTLTINLAGMTPALASTVLAAIDLDCWLRVTSMAPQTPGGTTVDVVVEGWRAQVSADTWTITCNVVSHALYAPVWVLGTSQLDTNTRLYV